MVDSKEVDCIDIEASPESREPRRAKTISNKINKLLVEAKSWVPWLPFGTDWNAAGAHNLVLLSELVYRQEDVLSQEGHLSEVVSGAYTRLLNNLAERKDRLIELAPSDIAPGGELPLMTRSVPEGEHFQDLRFWDSNQIGADREGAHGCRLNDKWESSESASFVLALLFAMLQLTGCTTADKSSYTQNAPVLQFYGTKSDSVRLMLSIRYVAQSSDIGCESFTTESMSMKPIRSTAFVLTQELDNVFIPGGDMLDVRVVPFTTSSRMGDVISYTWNTSLSWGGSSARCEFVPEKVNMRLYNQAGKNIGGMSFRDESWPLERGPEPKYEPLSAPVRVDCSRDHNINRSIRTRLCFAKQGRGTVFKIESESGDTTRIKLNVDV